MIDFRNPSVGQPARADAQNMGGNVAYPQIPPPDGIIVKGIVVQDPNNNRAVRDLS